MIRPKRSDEKYFACSMNPYYNERYCQDLEKYCDGLEKEIARFYVGRDYGRKHIFIYDPYTDTFTERGE